jgi:transcriptional regulator with XRE-family HTH domain
MPLTPTPIGQIDLSGLTTTSARIRHLKDLGYRQAEIARRLGISDQHVSNVVRGPRPQAETVPGMAEPAVARYGARPEPLPVRLSVDGAGRILLPREWTVSPGRVFIARSFGRSIVLMDIADASEAARAGGHLDSAVDDLIAERRLEAMREFDD